MESIYKRIFSICAVFQESRKLRYLNLSHNYFREEGGRLLGEAIAYNDSLEELDLSWNHLRQAGSVGIAEGLMVPIYFLFCF